MVSCNTCLAAAWCSIDFNRPFFNTPACRQNEQVTRQCGSVLACVPSAILVCLSSSGQTKASKHHPAKTMSPWCLVFTLGTLIQPHPTTHTHTLTKCHAPLKYVHASSIQPPLSHSPPWLAHVLEQLAAQKFPAIYQFQDVQRPSSMLHIVQVQ